MDLEILIFYLTLSLVSLTYLAIGCFITKKNAKYLLSGYNSMDKEKRRDFDIEKYLLFFKPFFKRLSVFVFVSWVPCYFILEFGAAVIVWSTLQILPFAYFLTKSLSFK